MNQNTTTIALWQVGVHARANGQTPEELAPSDFGQLLNFTDKASYLIFAAEWKAGYAELSQQIRQARATCRAAQRRGASFPHGDPEAGYQQAALVQRSQEARMELALRRASKRMAQELYLAAHAG